LSLTTLDPTPLAIVASPAGLGVSFSGDWSARQQWGALISTIRQRW
jgi:hypothetical protein